MHERDPDSEELERAILDGVRDADAAAATEPEPLIEARPVSAIRDPLPAPVLSLDGRGAVLAAGGAAVLSGEGGAGKSALLYGLALDVAAADTDPGVVSPAGPLRVHGGGPVLLTGYEDSPALIRWAVEQYGEGADIDPAVLDRVFVLDFKGDIRASAVASGARGTAAASGAQHEIGAAGFRSLRPRASGGLGGVDRRSAGRPDALMGRNRGRARAGLPEGEPRPGSPAVRAGAGA